MFVMLLGSFTYAQGGPTDGDISFDFSENSCIRSERLTAIDVKISEIDRLDHIYIERDIYSNFQGTVIHDIVIFYSTALPDTFDGSERYPIPVSPNGGAFNVEDISPGDFTNFLNGFESIVSQLTRVIFKSQIDARIIAELSNYPDVLIVYSTPQNYGGSGDALVFTDLDGNVRTQIEFNGLFEDKSQFEIDDYLGQIADVLAGL